MSLKTGIGERKSVIFAGIIMRMAANIRLSWIVLLV
jgi:hypothetical protein